MSVGGDAEEGLWGWEVGTGSVSIKSRRGVFYMGYYGERGKESTFGCSVPRNAGYNHKG